MGLPLLIHGIGSIGLFASRAFLPAFATALLLRFGPQVPWIADVGLLAHVRGVPAWFTSDRALIVLGLLSALELVAERVPEARAVLVEVHDYLKVGMAMLTFLGVVGVTDRAALRGIVGDAGPLDYAPSLAVGAGTLLAARVRGALLGPLTEADEDDDLGLQGLLRWVGDLWAALGPLALIVLPLLTLAAMGVALVTLALASRYAEAREDATRIPCPVCGASIYASANACPNCRAPVKEPRAVGLLGGTLARHADPAAHPYRLAAARRCPVCASRLRQRDVAPECEVCGSAPLAEPEFSRRYVAFVDRRVPATLAACGLLGLVPVLGLIPGVILYRLTIVAPFRHYLPPGRGFLLRWGVRLVILLLVALQWVPVAGGLAPPAMALINYAAYRTAYRRLAPAA